MTTLRRLVAVILLLYQGMCECLRDCSDFESFEKQVRGQLARVGCEVLSMIFEALDERLMQERDPNLRVVGFRDRTIVTVFGEMKIRRRLYEDKVTGETRFLLDERLGLEKRDRVSAGVKDLAVRLSTEMPFRRAADVLSEITPGISPMTAWNIVKEAGE
ncbi:MAG TPA: hypothetical protein GX510_04330 [Firmicutes bacterium]|nr:hypothetical protein [Candidatus Fermentithermobacillaceae bacterium]